MSVHPWPRSPFIRCYKHWNVVFITQESIIISQCNLVKYYRLLQESSLNAMRSVQNRNPALWGSWRGKGYVFWTLVDEARCSKIYDWKMFKKLCILFLYLAKLLQHWNRPVCPEFQKHKVYYRCRKIRNPALQFWICLSYRVDTAFDPATAYLF